MVFILFALAVILNLAFYRKKIYMNTGFMAVIMTLGIINFGVLHWPVNHSVINTMLYYATFFLWLIFWMNMLVTLANRSFVDRHFNSTINRFTIGTWVAGTSIIVVLTTFTGTANHIWLVMLALSNIFLWFGYLGLSLYTFWVGLTEWKNTILSGNLFLTTVSTQSIAIMLPTVFPELDGGFTLLIICLGLILYIVSFLFILSHFLINHWNATNCIFHGALSISGVALLYNKLIPMAYAIGFWTVVFAVLIIVEIIELIIFITKLKKHPIPDVLFKSNISHWSRLFTFGMFFTFTSLIEFKPGIMLVVKNSLLSALFVTIFCLLFVELISLAKLRAGNIKILKRG
ncbi:hypothetical protein D4T97_015245 [Siminovitchia acidinfaciens]|uniref:Uncharacterized protein n=1 Tax=Siminovitchia acidinfaciens TaxID=2321395 RepID=A0A429XWK9_9BACI|nr:hypothetical protein [Siminovitchia acidinfaciens]RST72772.1 hypothetical protein D4T97_015245 [Siminovitchia acidinfaciens]